MQDAFGGLLKEFWKDLQQPDLLWQIGALVLCLTVAWLADRVVQARVSSHAAEGLHAEELRLGRRGLRRLMFPVVGLLLVLLARQILGSWHNNVNLLSLAVPLLASLAAIRAVLVILRYSFPTALWLRAFERSFALLAWGIVALHIVGLLPSIIELLDGIGFAVGKQKLTLWSLLQGVGAVLATLLLALWVSGLVEARLLAAEALESNLRFVLARFSRALLIVVAVLVGLPAVGVDLTMLSVFGGALGVGLGFGLQKIAANYISGFIILLDRSLRIGDMIAVGNDRGQVLKITTRYTVLRSLSGVEAIVPNEVLVSSVVQNESYTDLKVRLALSVQVSYQAPVERALAILLEAAAAQPRVLVEPAPSAFLTEFAESGINLELGFWIADPESGAGALRSDINLSILRAFRAEGIDIPYPQREVRLLGAGEAPSPTIAND